MVGKVDNSNSVGGEPSETRIGGNAPDKEGKWPNIGGGEPGEFGCDGAERGGPGWAERGAADEFFQLGIGFAADSEIEQSGRQAGLARVRG